MLNKQIKENIFQLYDNKFNSDLKRKQTTIKSRQLSLDNQFNKIFKDKINDTSNHEVSKNHTKNEDKSNSKNIGLQTLKEETLTDESDIKKNESNEGNELAQAINMLITTLSSISQNNSGNNESNLHNKKSELVQTIEELLAKLASSSQTFSTNYEENFSYSTIATILTKIQKIIISSKFNKEISTLGLDKVLDKLQSFLESIDLNNNKLVQNFNKLNNEEKQNELTDNKEVNEKITPKKLLNLNIAKSEANNTLEKHEFMKIDEFMNTKVINFENEKVIDLVKSEQTLKSNVKTFENILNQIIENAKINITEDTSEMTIKLKPDNLGNLSMKIIVERGILVAKLDVESQIVKQAIEANLEDLRSALSDKGFEIKEFSVSVNQDSNQHQSLLDKYKKKKIKKVSFETDQVERNYETSQNYLNGLNSTINYLA